MIQEYQIRVQPVVASSEQNIRQFVAEDKGSEASTHDSAPFSSISL